MSPLVMGKRHLCTAGSTSLSSLGRVHSLAAGRPRWVTDDGDEERQQQPPAVQDSFPDSDPKCPSLHPTPTNKQPRKHALLERDAARAKEDGGDVSRSRHLP